MPRSARVDVGDEIYHVINRANGRLKIFETEEDYQLFEVLLEETKELVNMRILAYVVMPNHWHLVLYPRKDKDLGIFMHRLTNAHTRKVHSKTGTNGSGHLYQGRYKSFLVNSDKYLLTLIKYVERNPVRAGLSKYSEDWRWGSAWRRINGSNYKSKLVDLPPEPLPKEYRTWINTTDKEDDLSSIRNSITKSTPFGKDSWVDKMVVKYDLGSTLRSPGRPRKN